MHRGGPEPRLRSILYGVITASFHVEHPPGPLPRRDTRPHPACSSSTPAVWNGGLCNNAHRILLAPMFHVEQTANSIGSRRTTAAPFRRRHSRTRQREHAAELGPGETVHRRFQCQPMSPPHPKSTNAFALGVQREARPAGTEESDRTVGGHLLKPPAGCAFRIVPRIQMNSRGATP